MEKRIDAYSNQPRFRELFTTVRNAPFRAQLLVDLALPIFSGSTPLAKSDAYVDPPAGVRFIRSGEITADGRVVSESEVHLSPQIHGGMLKRSQIIDGDLLIAIVGATIGAAGIYRSTEPANINQAVAAVRLHSHIALPEFVCNFIHSPVGQRLLDFFKRPVARANINLEEIGEIPVILPPLTKQRELVSAMESARAARQTKLAEADALLVSLDCYLLDILKITLPPPDARRVFAIRLGTVRESRFDPDYFHPERILTVRGMEKVTGRLWCPSLHEAVTFQRDQIAEPGENYLSLAHVQSHTGELVAANEEAGGTCFTFQRDDVLFGRLRPYLNKVHRAERPGCCSPEFHVLRVKPDTALLPEYLATILRSSLILAQTRHMMTGNTHPRLANDDVVNLIIPVPDIAMQTTIAAEVRRRREAARALRTKAEADWAEAKRWFEEQLLGKP